MNVGLPAGAMRVVRRATRLDFIDGLGIAIGQRHVALAHLVKRLATVTLAHHHLAALPPQDQPDARRAALSSAVSGFLATHGIGADRAYVSLPRGNALLSRLALPSAARNDVRQVVEFEIDRLLPIPRDEVYFDFLVRDPGAGSEKLDVLVVALPRRIVGDHLAALEAAGVRARGVAITPVALLDVVSFAAGGEAPPTAMLVDDGGVVEIDFVAGHALRASHLLRSAEVASAAAVERLVAEEAAAAAIPASDVRVYAWRSGIVGAPQGAPAAGGASGEPGAPAGPPAAALGDDLVATGSDLVRGLESALSAPEGFYAAPDPALGPAIGAALDAVREGASGLNLLPLEERRAVEEGAPVLTFLSAAVLVVVTLVWLVSAMIKDHRISSELHQELASLEPKIREIHRNEEEAKGIRERLGILTQDDSRRVTVLLRELTEVIPESAYLSTFRVRNDRIELEGFAKSASDLVPLLEKSRHFRNAQFTSPVTKVQNNQERFSLTTEIEQ
ncbi:MAG TPA: PilN domain-containing protein [Candidatus Binatia bacterium]|nr:PilN domain-containing protein [Candidatus Binatia bacterium]